jgi:outer membrane lipoprotein carrier protein
VKTVSLSSILFLIPCSLIFIPVASGETGPEVLAKIQQRYENTKDLEANFIQESVGKIMKKPVRGEGKVYFKKRGMMRWDYQVPEQNLISDGHTFWYYQRGENQVLVSDVSGVVKEKTPLAFLAGEGNLTRDFSLLDFNEAVSPKEENFVIQVAPKEAHAAMAKLALTVDKKTYTVVQADVYDMVGNVTRTRFLNIKTNVDLPNTLFSFTIPPGTEVLKFEEPPAPSPGGKGSSK